MKLLAIMSLFLLGSVVHADSDGDKAMALYHALKASGAKVNMYPDATFISVRDVKCSSMLISRGAFGTCQMYDENAGKKLSIKDNVDSGEHGVSSLMQKMSESGAKTDMRAGGSSVDASAIVCSAVSFSGAHFHCAVKN